MSLIIMCCYDTEENGRSEYTHQTLESLWSTVDFTKHELVVVDNGSCEATKRLLRKAKEREGHTLITLSENIGTARGINMGLKLRKTGEHAVKIDNDVVIHQQGWVEEMEEIFRREPKAGIVGFKRKDLQWDGELVMLPHIAGEKWVVVEKGVYIMGTVTMLSSGLLDRIGGFIQVGVYGFDDTLFSLRSSLSGFQNYYLPSVNIDHIDNGNNPYTQEKHNQAAEAWAGFEELHKGYVDGTIDLYYEG